MVLYVDGDLRIDGTVSMTARGTNAAGENLVVASGVSVSATGGGGGGARSCCSYYATSGAGAAGTSYSGGSGGGGALVGGDRITSGATGGNAAGNGGIGGTGVRCGSTASEVYRPKPGGGAGNPGGVSQAGTAYYGQDGAGGLLVIVTTGNLTIGSSGIVESRGFVGGNGHNYGDGGGSGGGSVILLHGGGFSNAGTLDLSGGVMGGGGRGGTGSFYQGAYAG